MTDLLTASGPDVSAQLLGSGLIGLREGLEAGIVVMILIAFLVKADRRDALKWVWLGVGGAIAVTVGVFLAILYSAYSVSGLAADVVTLDSSPSVQGVVALVQGTIDALVMVAAPGYHAARIYESVGFVQDPAEHTYGVCAAG